jgi:hypothetical protein
MASRRPSRPLPASPSFLWPFLSSCTNPYVPLCLCNTPTRTREPQFPCAAASGFPRRRRSVAAGEGLDPPPVFFDFWDRQELDKLVLSQVFAPDTRGSRAPSSPERRPSRRRRRAPLLPSPPVSPLSSSVRGKHHPPPNSSSFRAQHRLPELARVTAPPPYGAGRR